MNIDDLTLGQLKEIIFLYGGDNIAARTTPQPHPFAWQYVICRCTGAGVHAGTLVSAEGDTVILSNSRRLWSWTAAGGIALSGVAQHGIVQEKSRLDAANPAIQLTGVCEIIPCSAKAREGIENA